MAWHLGQRRARLLAIGLATGFGAYAGLYALAVPWHDGMAGDFAALWADGRILAAHPAAEIYDPAATHARQVALGLPAAGSTPFPYPPSFFPVVQILGLLPLGAAFAGFMAATAGLYLLAVALPRPRPPLVLASLLAPAGIVALVAGQSGFLAAGLLLGGLRLAGGGPSRRFGPVLGGVLLGLLAYKPQFGLLLPVALAAAGAWRAIAAAVVTVALMALATSAAYGWHIWADWAAYLPAFSDQFVRQSGDLLFLMPTPTAALRMLGAPAWVFGPARAGLALAAGWWVWRACRAGLTARAVLVVVTATLLAAPYAFVYDLPMLAGAVLLRLADRAIAAPGLSGAEVAALILALLLPAAMLHGGRAVPVGAPCLALLAAVLIAAPTPGRPAVRA